MICKTIEIKPDYAQLKVTPPQKAATLTTYLLDVATLKTRTWSKRPAVIVCPGGGYEFCSDREAEPIALAFAGRGFHSFVLNYSCKPTGFPCALTEISKAVAYVRSIAGENDIDPDQIYVCGFSAGAHVACSLGVYWNTDWLKEYTGILGDENKPNGMILCYPVISGKKGVRHTGSLRSWECGKQGIESLFSLEDHVTADTPKTFLWHTCTDNGVSVQNSLQFASALNRHGVGFELHVFPYGAHGLSLACPITTDANWENWQNREEVAQWIDLACRFIMQQRVKQEYVTGEQADWD